MERTRKVRAYLSSFKKEEKGEYGLIRLANKPLWDAVICNIEVSSVYANAMAIRVYVAN